MKLEIGCCFCEDKFSMEFEAPGWAVQSAYVDEEMGFCPKHSPIEQFTNYQCVGCVSGWGDCGMWRAFAYSKNEMTDDYHRSLRAGVCPKRVNGTISVSIERGFSRMDDLNISSPAAVAGAAFSVAIEEYIAKYHKEHT
jgi:hypothetical protein